MIGCKPGLVMGVVSLVLAVGLLLVVVRNWLLALASAPLLVRVQAFARISRPVEPMKRQVWRSEQMSWLWLEVWFELDQLSQRHQRRCWTSKRSGSASGFYQYLVDSLPR